MPGKPHPIQDLIQKTREIFLDLNFDEVENPIFISEEDVYKQYGKEGAIILDRVYYLAGLPRPDIGLSQEKIDEISKVLNIEVNEKFVKNLTKVLRNYREGLIEGDNLVEEFMKKLNINNEQALNLLEIFKEFKNLKPIASNLTLRSHMTAGWFLTLESLKKRNVRLFSIGLRFRREQKLDATHLRAHYGASCVIMDENFNIENGFEISKEIFKRLGFEKLDFRKKKATSNYYEKDSEYEIFSNNIEIGDCGLYSTKTLKNYGIDKKVFNLGFGIERIIMVKNKINDVRNVMFPQFYEIELTDNDIAKEIKILKHPETEEGEILMKNIEKVAKENANEKTPCKFLVYDGKFLGKNLKVFIAKYEENKNLLGPASLNDVYVFNQNIYGIILSLSEKGEKYLPQDISEIKEKGVFAISYIEAISAFFAYEIEEFVKHCNKKTEKKFFEIKDAKSSNDINILIPEYIREFISSKQKKIIIKGPIFIGVEIELKNYKF